MIKYDNDIGFYVLNFVKQFYYCKIFCGFLQNNVQFIALSFVVILRSWSSFLSINLEFWNSLKQSTPTFNAFLYMLLFFLLISKLAQKVN